MSVVHTSTRDREDIVSWQMNSIELPTAKVLSDTEDGIDCPDLENTVCKGEWRSSDYGECETRPHVVQSSRGFHTGLEVSYGGGDCTPDCHFEAFPTREQALAKTLSREARWHHEEYAQEDTPGPSKTARKENLLMKKKGRSR